ncbi:AtpZ/AtpI family protein [Candidatus Saccharibacteria bacterium]|nr:AtpZ/AtpI family protein [Candidatus Saccharibacteria bacterium]
MREPNDIPSGTPRPPKNSTVVLLLGTMLDTTWRMFGPTLGLAALGLWADTRSGTGPLYSLLGVGIGIVIAALLVRHQFKKVKE